MVSLTFEIALRSESLPGGVGGKLARGLAAARRESVNPCPGRGATRPRQEDSMRTKPIVPALLALALAGGRAPAQEHVHDPLHAHAAEALGAVHLPTSCKAEVQAAFDRAVALLHSFGYEAAREAFAAVAAEDPECGMAHWGIAMTLYHPLWAPPAPAELAQGRAAAEQAAALGTETERERAYIAAIGAFYRDAEARDHRARAEAYRVAMEDLHRGFPEDPEAAVFYALALLGTAPPSDPTHAQQRQAAEILDRLLAEQPNHPGIPHYLIHSLDYPSLAELALPAARAYAAIAPSSPHALHMPSHIFTRLGLWEESIASNLASQQAADRIVASKHPGAASFDALHALDYLEYTYLQLGREEEATAVLDEAARATTFDDPNFAAGYALVAIPARYRLERQSWAEAAQLEPPRVGLPWERFSYAPAITHFARAVGAARSGDAAAARAALVELDVIRDGLRQAPPAGPYDWADQVESLRLAAAGWLAHVEGRTEEALDLLRRAADLQDRTGKHPVTPGEILPARELLADLLREMGRPAEALAEYEASLAAAPGRLYALRGAAQAARLGGDTERARELEERITAQCGPRCASPGAVATRSSD